MEMLKLKAQFKNSNGIWKMTIPDVTLKMENDQNGGEV